MFLVISLPVLLLAFFLPLYTLTIATPDDLIYF